MTRVADDFKLTSRAGFAEYAFEGPFDRDVSFLLGLSGFKHVQLTRHSNQVRTARTACANTTLLSSKIGMKADKNVTAHGSFSFAYIRLLLAQEI